jgi:Icc-related predicted phosphoesterase
VSWVRLFFVTDLHGSDLCFRKFLNSAKFYGADVLVLGGDVVGKRAVPYWEEPDGFLVADEQPVRGLTREGLDDLLRAIRDQGGYPYRTTQQELDAIKDDDAAVEALFERLACESIGRWLELAEERLRGSGVRCLISPGNDDPPAIDRLLDDAGVSENPEGRVVEIGEFTMVSCGIANRTPWHSYREQDEDELEVTLEGLIAGVPDARRSIFNFHVPPRDTPLDVAPLLDEDLKPVLRGGQMETAHVGSTAVRATIERHRPMLALHGHIHESRGAWRAKKSLCLNPGSEYPDGVLRGALVELGGRKGIRAYQLTQG